MDKRVADAMLTFGETPLFRAVHGGQLEVRRALLI
jgi:hypothetical protein